MSVPVRIERKGFRRWFPATRKEIKAAAAFAELEARAWIWKSPEALLGYMNWMMGEQLACHVEAGVEAFHGEHDWPLMVFVVGKVEHYTAVRDTQIQETLALQTEVRGTIAGRMSTLPGQPGPDMKGAVAALAQKVGATSTPVASAPKAPAAAPVTAGKTDPKKK